MKLTRRQQTVLRNFLDLYHENEEALHYTAVAEQLSVNPITAYDMLRLLEDRGLLASDYVPPSQGEGSGRARVVFRPTPMAQALLNDLAGESWQQEEWDVVRERILNALHAGKGSDYQGMLDDLMVRISKQRSPLLYTAEMITAIILEVHQLAKEAADSSLYEKLRSLGLPDEIGLSALGGLAVGLSFAERANRRVTGFFLANSGRYQEMLNRLGSSNKQSLSDFADEVLEIVEA